MDEARKKTDKRLKELEKEVGGVYWANPALNRVARKFQKFMADVGEKVRAEYEAYLDDPSPENKKAYISAVEELTLRNKAYKRLLEEIVEVLSDVNADALDIINGAMLDIYCWNYNQVAVQCKEVGIDVEE